MNSWIEVSQDYIGCKIVLRFSNSRIPDYYSMSVHLLRGILQPVAMLVNECLSTGILPDALKIARSIPVFKKRDP